jgi:outer membrane lipoprotein carrier protein
VRRHLTLCCLIIAIALTTTAVPPADAPASLDDLVGADKVHALIDGIVARQRALTSMRAQFVQHKASSLLLEPMESRGEFRFRAPDRVRWDYVEPEPMVVLFSADVLTTFHPERKLAERVKLSKRHRRFVRVLAGTQPLDELTTNFSVTLRDSGAPAPYRLVLEPTHAMIKKRLESVVLEVDRELLLPTIVEYHERDGDSTRYEFSSLELNPQLEASLFDLELADDVVVETIDASAGGP